jgi:anti-sigma B factor antagonist
MPVTPRISLTNDEGVTVVHFLERRLFDDSIVREVGEQLMAALPTGTALLVVLDFTGVEIVSSAMLGKLILLQRRVDASGGKLRLCELGDAVRGVFKSTNLDRLFGIDRDVRAALEALGRG